MSIKKPNSLQQFQIFFIVLGVFCLAAIVFNVVVRRGPVNDATIESDLSTISSAINGSVSNGSALPATLSDLPGLPTATAKRLGNYEYIPEGSGQYQLCATFQAASQNGSVKPYSLVYGAPDTSVHVKGRDCFNYSVTLNGPLGRPVPM